MQSALRTSTEHMSPPPHTVANRKDGIASSLVDTTMKCGSKGLGSKGNGSTSVRGSLWTSRQLKHQAQAKRLLLAQAAAEENVKLKAEILVLKSEVSSLQHLLHSATTTLSMWIQSPMVPSEAVRYSDPIHGLLPVAIGSPQWKMDSMFDVTYNSMTSPPNRPPEY